MSLCVQVPGSPGVQVVMYFRASEEARDAIRHGQAPPPPIAPHSTEKEEEGGSTKTSPDTDTKADTDTDTQPPPAPLQGWQKTLNRFWQADQDYCDARFKVIPCMVTTSLCRTCTHTLTHSMALLVSHYVLYLALCSCNTHQTHLHRCHGVCIHMTGQEGALGREDGCGRKTRTGGQEAAAVLLPR